MAHHTPEKEALNEETYCNAVRPHDAQVAELTQIVDQLRAVVETLRKMLHEAERDQDLDLGVLDLPAKDRAALKKLDTDGRARP